MFSTTAFCPNVMKKYQIYRLLKLYIGNMTFSIFLNSKIRF